MYRMLVYGALAAALFAGPRATPSMAGGGDEAAKDRYVFRIESANKIIGMDLYTDKEISLGRVKDIVIDVQHNHALFALVTPAGELYGDPVAVPYKVVDLRDKGAGRILYLATDPSFFKNAPRLAGKPEETTDLAFCRKAYMHFGMICPCDLPAPSHEEKAGDKIGMKVAAEGEEMKVPPIAIRNLVGRDVRNVMNETLGQIENVKIDQKEGRIVYGVVSIPAGVEKGMRLAAVPWAAFAFSAERPEPVLNVRKGALEEVSFIEMHGPDLTEFDYARKLHAHFNVTPYWVEYGYVMDVDAQPCSWVPGSEFNRKFNCAAQETVEGRVVSVGCFTPEDGAVPGLRLRIEKEGGMSVVVFGGPISFMEEKDLNFSVGEKLAVTGCMADVAGRQVLMAREIRNGDKVFRLRDETGKPMWSLEDYAGMEKTSKPAEKQ